MKIPHTTPALWTALALERFAGAIHQDKPAGCSIGLLGLPDDAGVRLNRGRLGARQGPDSFRAAFAWYGTAEPPGQPWPRVFDAGNIIPAATLEETHDRVTAATTALLDAGLLPVAIGGGHDLTFPFVRALAGKFSPLTGVYFDAHLDVRETPGSGMAFRKIVEDCSVRELHLHGFRPFVNSRAHHEWFLAHGGRIHPDEAKVLLPRTAKNLFVSFDLDVLDQSFAPGVSAPNPAGWTARDAERWIQACGADPRVRCFDLMEFCPAHDHGSRTMRLIAHLFLTFLAGFTERP